MSKSWCLAVALVLVAGCATDAAVTCEDGTICPENYRCDVARDACLSPGQIAACDGLADGTDCTVLASRGTCSGGACIVHVCGDGVRQDTEECDGADLGGADCTSFAQIHARFYAPAGLACTADCTFDVAACTQFCGDGIVDGPEACDGTPPDQACSQFGYDAGAIGCDAALCSQSFATCARFGWRFEPIAGVNGQSFTGQVVTGTGPHDEWVLGAGGAAARFDGLVWTTEASGASDDFVGASATAPGALWAATSTTIHHRTSAGAWQLVASPATTFTAIYAHDDAAVFAATTAGVIRYDGASWQPVGTLAAKVYDVSGTSATDLYAATDAGIEHFDGASWTLAPPVLKATHLYARVADDVWATGFATDFSHGVRAHWDGHAWTTVTTLNVNDEVPFGSGPEDWWFVVEIGGATHYDGVGFTALNSTADITGRGVGGFGAKEAIEAAAGGAYRFTGQAVGPLAITSGLGGLVGIYAPTPDHIVVADVTSRVSTLANEKWTTVTPGPSIAMLVGFAADDLWIAGAGGQILHFDGTWKDTNANLSVVAKLAGTSSTDLWAATTTASYVQHYDATGWSRAAQWTDGLPASFAMHALAAAGSDAWLATDDAIYRHTGATWTLAAPISGNIVTMVAFPGGHLYAAGDQALGIVVFDGQAWSTSPVPFPDAIKELVGTAPDDVFAHSLKSFAHFDGRRWSPVAMPHINTNASYSVSAISHEVILAGESPGAGLDVIARIEPWACRAHETACDDGIDDDCDGAIDGADSDCPP